MENKFVALTDKDLEEARVKLCQKWDNLPGKFQVSNEEFSWTWRKYDKKISIESQIINFGYYLKEDGTIASYSFPSQKGEHKDIAETLLIYQMYIHLLSEEFRIQIAEDCRSKRAVMDAIDKEIDSIDLEKKRREKGIPIDSTPEPAPIVVSKPEQKLKDKVLEKPRDVKKATAKSTSKSQGEVGKEEPFRFKKQAMIVDSKESLRKAYFILNRFEALNAEENLEYKVLLTEIRDSLERVVSGFGCDALRIWEGLMGSPPGALLANRINRQTQ